MARVMPRLFIIRCRGESKPVIGEDLQNILRHEIESCDYELMNDYSINWDLLKAIKDQLEFTYNHKKEIEKFVKYYLVITTQKNIVLGFIRI